TAARMPMIATTIISSISVKPCCTVLFFILTSLRVSGDPPLDTRVVTLLRSSYAQHDAQYVPFVLRHRRTARNACFVRLRNQFLLTLLGTGALVLLVMASAVQLTFQHSLEQYLGQRLHQRLQLL